MKKLTRLLLFSFIILISSTLTSQTTHYVIAPNGLKLREGPSANHTVIDILSFGQMVYKLSDSIYRVDTLKTIKNYGYYELFLENEQFIGFGDRTILGQWIKVKYNDQVGYVVDAYINSTKPEIEDHYDLIYIDRSNTTWSLYFNPARYFWYSLLIRDRGVEITNIVPEFISTESEFSGSTIQDVYENRSISLGLIGSVNNLKTDQVKYKYLYEFEFDTLNSEFQFVELNGPDKSYGSELIDSVWIFELVDKSAPLTRSIFKLGKGTSRPMHLRLIADLDSDNINDYVVFCETIYDLYEIVLFLSGDIEDGSYIKSGSSYLDFD